jgi:hypothetical protein
MALPSPSGIAMVTAIRVMTIVPITSGSTPNCPSAKSGVHVVVKRNSVSGISAKNSSDGMRSESTIPKVVRIETAAAAKRMPRMTFSP